MKSFIEQYFGISSGSGSTEGGGGMMGGLMDNMLGGGTGDLLGGLLGGLDGGGTGSAGTLEGDVRFGMDVPFNAIYVAGATGNDLDQIAELIEVLDQPEAPHNPNLVGEFRTIPIIHRDPIKIKELVLTQLSGLIDTGESKGGNQQNNESAQMIKMMQQLTGGNRGGGGGGVEAEQEKPKVRLDVDPETNCLLVTGPEFIYNQILVIVNELDREELSIAPTMTMFQRPGNTAEIKTILKQMFGDKVEIVDSTETDGSTKAAGAGNANPASSASDPAKNAEAQKQQEQARAAIINAMRQQQQRGGGGRPTGGGGRGGGGGRPTGGGGGPGGR